MIEINERYNVSNHIPELRPLRLNNIDVEDLNAAQHKQKRRSGKTH